jgi:hypothetical protein
MTYSPEKTLKCEAFPPQRMAREMLQEWGKDPSIKIIEGEVCETDFYTFQNALFARYLLLLSEENPSLNEAEILQKELDFSKRINNNQALGINVPPRIVAKKIAQGDENLKREMYARIQGEKKISSEDFISFILENGQSEK